MQKPLIVTLQLEKPAQEYFTDLRREYFPAHINYLDAHLTLFHVLPSDEPIIFDALEMFAKRDIIQLTVEGLRNIGNGVAYKIVSAELQLMHAAMQERFHPFLVGKDKEKLWPHITVQNKVTAFKAKSLFEKLSGEFKPFNIETTGISTFLYDDGPWIPLKDISFVP